MKPISIRRWLLAGVLGTTVAVGCRGIEPDPLLTTPPPPDAPAPDVSKASAEIPEDSSSEEKTPTGKPEPVSSEKTVSKAEPEVKAAAAPAVMALPPADVTPSLEEVRKTISDPTQTATAKPNPVGLESEIKPVKVDSPEKPPTLPMLGESKSPCDPPVSEGTRPCYSHSEDYSVLSGQLEHFGRSWRLRYAALDEVDTYGGSVTLLEDARLAALQEGQKVRIRGQIMDREARTGAPPYRINTIEPIESHEAARGQP
jgi:hypothetical protein